MSAMYLLGSILLVLSAGARFLFFPVITSDFTYFLAKWFDTLHASVGLSAFAQPFADYAPLYLYLIKLLTFIPLPSLYSVKGLSVLFDVITALAVCGMLYALGEKSRPKLFLSFAVVMAAPSLLLNSSLWGQSDSLYAACVALSLMCVVWDRPAGAAAFFSLAFCFKFQSIFFLPILAGYLVRRQESVAYLLAAPLAFFLSVVPAWASGGQLLYWLTMYAKQSAEYRGLSVSSQSIYAFVQPITLSAAAYEVLFWVGLALAAAAAVGFALLMARAGLSEQRRVLLLTLLCVSALPYLLPRMHERYFYLADVVSVLYALYAPREWILPVLVVGASVLSYFPYLSQFYPFPWIDLRIPSVIMLAALILMVVKLRRLPEVYSAADFRQP